MVLQFILAKFKKMAPDTKTDVLPVYDIEQIPAEISDVFENIRSLYVDYFLNTAKKIGGSKCITEAILLNKEGKPIGEGILNSATRVDIFSVDNGLSHIPSAEQLNFDRFFFRLLDAKIQVDPFTWDQLFLVANVAPNNETMLILTNWFNNSFLGEVESGNGNELECIHYMSDPDPSSSVTQLQIDLGTASTAVLFELFKALALAGSTEISISEIPGED
jgi:hypothetical protein